MEVAEPQLSPKPSLKLASSSKLQRQRTDSTSNPFKFYSLSSLLALKRKKLCGMAKEDDLGSSNLI